MSIEFAKIGIHFKMPVYRVDDIWAGMEGSCFSADLRRRLESSREFILDLTGYHTGHDTVSVLKTLLTQADLIDGARFLTETSFVNDSDPAIIYFAKSFYNASFLNADRPRAINRHRQYKISCLNRMSRPQRLYVFYQLFHREYFGSSLISCRGLVDSYTESSLSLDSQEYQDLPKEVHDFFLKKNTFWESIPGDATTQDYVTIYSSVGHPAYADSLLNIVTESTVADDMICLSEKICKPLRSQQLFTLVGNKDAMHLLRTMGFDCFDQDLDHHDYDKKPNWIYRIDSMLTLIDQKYQQLDEIYQRNRSGLEHNQQWFYSSNFREKLLENLRLRDLII
jgi:hypothetical protein